MIRAAIIAAAVLLTIWGAEEARHHYERGPLIVMKGYFAWDTVNKQCVEFRQVRDGMAMFVTRDDLGQEQCKPLR